MKRKVSCGEGFWNTKKCVGIEYVIVDSSCMKSNNRKFCVHVHVEINDQLKN